MNIKQKAMRYDAGIESIREMMVSAENNATRCAEKYGVNSVLVADYLTRARAYKCAILALTDWQD
jgi:hypothetical protein